MIYNANIIIGFKKSIGEYDVKELSLFRLKDQQEMTTLKNFQILRGGRVVFSFKCPICEQYHQYTYNLKDLLLRKLTVGGCEVTGAPIFFAGDYKMISNIISKYQDINKKLYNIM